MRKILAMSVVAMLAGVCLGVEMGRAEEAATGPATAASQGAGIPKELAGRMDEWIGLLKAGKNKELVESMMSPEELARAKTPPTTMGSGGTLPTVADMEAKFDRMVDEFGKRGAADLLKEMEGARTQAPTLNADGTKAGFAKVGTGRGPALKFKKVGEIWYLDGH